jgi:hypothetical protein
MRSAAAARSAAVVASVGFFGLAVFQGLLAAGVPWGEAAWGGANEGRLPTGLRVGSAVSIVVYVLAASVVMKRAGLAARWVPGGVARIGSWVLVALLTLGALANLLSQSPWERFLLGPVTLVLAGSCLVVARAEEETSVDPGTAARPQARTARHTDA